MMVLGLFDDSLPGVDQEIESLRNLVRSGYVDGKAFSWSSVSIEQALTEARFDLLTVSAHGALTAGIPTLELPRGSIGVPQILRWPVPRQVCFAACRSAQGGPSNTPTDLVTACIRQGARSVLAARWPIPDESIGRMLSSIYTAMATRNLPLSLAARSAALDERDRNSNPWFWAGLGLFGTA